MNNLHTNIVTGINYRMPEMQLDFYFSKRIAILSVWFSFENKPG